MRAEIELTIKGLCEDHGNDRGRLLDVLTAVQRLQGCVSPEAQALVAEALGSSLVEVKSALSFYAFLSEAPKGLVVIRLCDDVVDEMKGSRRVARALEEELGIRFGETTPDGKFTLEYTPCIGMCDQAPAALVNDVVVTDLGPDRAREGIKKLREHMDPHKLVRHFGDGNNAHDLVKAPVRNHICQAGDVLLADSNRGDGLRNALAMSSVEVINQIKNSRLRGRGGAGFPTGMKWEFTRGATGDQRYLICNADEGEPGTFKDRVLLTERADLLFEGMAIGGYAIGANEGILYLRGEYTYLQAYLESVLDAMRTDGLLGKNILGKEGFDFDIRIQMGAGAYICGEESALINSCEGLRGDPRNRPPFPAQKGYKGCPTSVNNVETLCCVTRIMEKSAAWFTGLGSTGSSGTKLLSISGDCMRPGIYEIPFGISLTAICELCGAEEPAAAQVGGPSGKMIPVDDFGKTICFDHLATGGALVFFGKDRDLLAIASKYMDFFIEESCGYCTPCRVGNLLLKERLDRIRGGLGEAADIEYLRELAATIKSASRCGLGQTSPNPILTTMENFPHLYGEKLIEAEEGMQPGFDIQAVLEEAKALTGRDSVHFTS